MSLAIRWTPADTSSLSRQGSVFYRYLSVGGVLCGRAFTLIVKMYLALFSVDLNAEDVIWRRGHFVNFSFAEKATVDCGADLIPDHTDSRIGPHFAALHLKYFQILVNG